MRLLDTYEQRFSSPLHLRIGYQRIAELVEEAMEFKQFLECEEPVPHITNDRERGQKCCIT